MHQSRLSNLSLLTSERDAAKEFGIESVINNFAKIKERLIAI